MKFIISALAGVTAGILGLTGLFGFIFYIFALLSFFGFFILKTGSTWNKYFISRNSLVTNGVSFISFLLILVDFNWDTMKSTKKLKSQSTNIFFLFLQFLGGLCTYILFWTFAYGCMHVYWKFCGNKNYLIWKLMPKSFYFLKLFLKCFLDFWSFSIFRCNLIPIRRWS